MRGCGAVLLWLGACTGPDFGPPPVPTLEVDEMSPLAVGSTTRIGVVTRGCLFGGPEATCYVHPENVLEHRIEPAGAFEVIRRETEYDVDFVITAVAEGVARFYVDVNHDGEMLELGYNIRASTIDAVSLQTPCASPAVMQAGIATTFAYEMRNGLDRLNGRIMLFTIVGAELTPPDEDGVEWLRLPVTPGTVTITSPYDADFTHVIDVVDRDLVDGLAITDAMSPISVGSLLHSRADLLVGTRAICGGSMPITTTISTPDRCALDPGYGRSSDTIRINAIAAGDCTVHVTLDGTSISATKTFVVM